MESIHGHELMRWLGANGPLSREELLEGARKEFGDARFHTCSLEGLTADGLVDFLLEKGKIGSSSAGLHLAMEPCDH